MIIRLQSILLLSVLEMRIACGAQLITGTAAAHVTSNFTSRIWRYTITLHEYWGRKPKE
jgi:hypothetical protein